MKSRGLRNNNPLNIRRTGVDTWKGMSTSQTDELFLQFESMVMGYRAAAVLIRNYDIMYGINTVSAIISRWAPSSENNTLAYIRRVCHLTEFAPDHLIHAGHKSYNHDLCRLLLAMASVECATDLMLNALHRSYVSAAADMICFAK